MQCTKLPWLSHKNNWSVISKFPRTVYIFSYYFMNLRNLTAWDKKLREHWSLHCRSFSQNMYREITPKVRRMSYNLLQVKSLDRHISQTIRRIEKHFFDWKFIYVYFIYSAKIAIYKFYSVRSNVDGNLKNSWGWNSQNIFLKKEHSASAQKLDVSYKKKECNCNLSLDLQSCKSS